MCELISLGNYLYFDSVVIFVFKQDGSFDVQSQKAVTAFFFKWAATAFWLCKKVSWLALPSVTSIRPSGMQASKTLSLSGG